MANITITKSSPWTRALWFIALWLGGVGGAMLLALPFKLMIRAAMH